MATEERPQPTLEAEPAEREKLIVFCLDDEEAEKASRAFADVPSVELGYIYYSPIVEGYFVTPTLLRQNGGVNSGLDEIRKLASTRRAGERDFQDEQGDPSRNYEHWKNRLWPVNS